MKTTNKTARALSLSILSTFLCVVMLFGMTYAWFRVEVNSDNNVIKIGAFDAKVYYHDTYIAADASGWADFADATVFNTTLFPGDEVVRYIKFENNCGYPVKFDLVLPAGATFDTDGKVNNLYVYTADSVSDTVTVSAMTSLNNLGAIGTAATAEAPTQLITKMLAANTSAIVAVGIKLPDTYSTASSTDTSETFKLRVIATQWNAPHVTVTNAAAAQTLSTGQVTVTVPATDVAVDDKLVLTVSNVVETTGTLSCDITLKKNDVTVTSAPAPIAVDINVGTGKTITSVKHNGTDIAFTYDSTTGILSFTTSSFSPFEVNYVTGSYEAMVGSTVYDTFEAALAAAPSGATVKLLADIDYSTTYTERNARDNDRGHSVDLKDLTVDLNGHKISTINASVTFCGNGATIKNGTFDLVHKATNGSYQAGSYALILDNEVSTYPATAKITLKDVVCNGGANFCYVTAELDNVTTETTATKYYAVWAEHSAKVTIKSGTYTDEQTGGKGIFATGTGEDGGAVISVLGGTFNGVNKLVYSAEAGSIKIYGGTYNLDPTSPTNYLATDGLSLEAVEEPAGIWTVQSVISGGGQDASGFPVNPPAIPGFGS